MHNATSADAVFDGGAHAHLPNFCFTRSGFLNFQPAPAPRLFGCEALRDEAFHYGFKISLHLAIQILFDLTTVSPAVKRLS